MLHALSALLLSGVAALGASRNTPPPSWAGGDKLHAAEELATQARYLARQGDADAELQAWERVLDRSEPAAPLRSEARTRMAHLRAKLGPVHADSHSARPWRVLVLALRRVDFEYRAADGRSQRFVARADDSELRDMRASMEAFALQVRRGTNGVRRIDYAWRVVDAPQRAYSGDAVSGFWLGPWDLRDKLSAQMRDESWDSVFVYSPFEDGTQRLPQAYAGCSYGGDLGPAGAGWAHLSWSSASRPDGEIELHEWLHLVDWAFAHRSGYPDALVPDPDDGLPHGTRAGAKGLAWYSEMMQSWVTRGMWHEVSMHEPLPNPFVRRSLTSVRVCGPFLADNAREAWERDWLDIRTLDLRGRPLGSQLAWREVHLTRTGLPAAKGPATLYLGTFVESQRAQAALLSISCDAPYEVWLSTTTTEGMQTVQLATRPRGSREEYLPLTLPAGESRLIWKLASAGPAPRLVLRLCDGSGSPLTDANVRVD